MALNIVNSGNLFDRAVVLHNAGRLAEAEQCYRQILSINSNDVACLNNMAALAIAAGQPVAALDFLKRLLALQPNNADAYNVMGEAYRAILRGTEAVDCYNRAIALNPHHISAYNNRGIVEAITGNIVASIRSWTRAIEIANAQGSTPRQLSLIFNNLGNAHLEQGDPAEAIRNHEYASQLDPRSEIYFSNLLRDWNHAADISPRRMLELHRTWWMRHAAGIVPLLLQPTFDPEKKLRVGFVSPDLREHAVTYFLLGLFEHYDKSRFEFICYGNVTSPDAFTNRIAAHASASKNILGMMDAAAADLIRRDNIDVLIDLAGHTAGNRLGLFAYRPAPVQVTYLGYPVTTGGDAITWRITDKLADPPGLTDSHFSENLFRLDRPAWCYRPPCDAQAFESPPSIRLNKPFTFGSFNNYSKVTPEMIALWAEILKMAPASQLLLKANALSDPAVVEQARKRFAAHGIDAARLLFSGKQLATQDHLERYNDVDLALDTFPYHGTTTTCEALWMNVPVIVLEGQSHLSRVGVSLLTAVAMADLIAPTPQAYVAKAVELATDTEKLITLRKGLRQRMESSPLMNAPDFASAFCAALREMWKQRCAAVTR